MRSRSHGLRAALPLIALAACGPPRYEAPSLTAPHATVTVRVIHHDISERVAAVRGAPLTRSVRVRPRPDRWEFRSVFSLTEVRMETVMENEQYNCGTQTVGFGASARTQPRTCTRSVPRTRSVTRRVVDGECRAIAPFSPRVDGHYVMQFDYHGPGSCRARCFEQTPQADGGFALRPC